MSDQLLFALWYFLPAGLANMAPVLANRVPLLNQWRAPMDMHRSYKGIRILGDNKSWRGFATGVTIASLVVLIQHLLASRFYIDWLSQSTAIDYTKTGILWLGPLLGIGALGGDALESFFKRQLRIPSGESWFPFDQLDYILGGLVIAGPFFPVPFWVVMGVFVIFFVLHLLSAYTGYLLGLKDRPI